MKASPQIQQEDFPATDRALVFNLSVAAAVNLSYAFMEERVHPVLQALLALALLGSFVFRGRILGAWWIWALLGLALIAALVKAPLDMANHHFLLTYTNFACAISLSAPRDLVFNLLRTNVRLLIVVLMGVATFQRLLQPTFMDGSFVAYLIATGGFCRPLLPFLPEISEIVSENASLAENLRAASPWELESVTLTPPVPSFPLVTMIFVWVILAIEAWICLAMAFFPKQLFTHLSLLAFAAVLAILRQELTFISVLCMLGLLSCDRSRPILRNVYGLLAVIFAVAPLKI